MSTAEDFKRLLRELFQLDQAELDFGIYRILRIRRDEIIRFLDDELLPRVATAFAQHKAGDRAAIEFELESTTKQLREDGFDPEASKKVKDLRAKLAATADVAALEREVFSDLYTFFSRYYNEGDFISQRRYKDGVYAIPYGGEEVKLHWANADQYYIKTSEDFQSFAFTLPSGRKARFEVIAHTGESDGAGAKVGNDKRFLLANKDPMILDKGELVIRFVHKSEPEKRKQAEINAQICDRVLKEGHFEDWTRELAQKAPTATDPNRTFLEKQLAAYTAKNTFDYFIHKDLGSFLRRELDFFIKNEILYLDDIVDETPERTAGKLSRVKVIRSIASDIIDFIAQLEEFQKKLWLKKKFVTETRYCIAVRLIPEEFYREILDNRSQLSEWEALGVEKSAGADWNIDELRGNPTLLVDTRHFPENFVLRLLSSSPDLDSMLDGVLIHSENFQALSLMQARYSGQVKCIYIDPPYNTGQDGFLYKDAYQSSSWAAMIRDRLTLSRELLTPDGVLFASINEIERATLEWQLREVFGRENRVEELIWVRDTVSNNAPAYSTNHEYVEAYAKSRKRVEQSPSMFREVRPGYDEVIATVDRLLPDFPPIETIEETIRQLYQNHRAKHLQEAMGRGETREDAVKSDPWKGLYPYKHAEYRSKEGKLVSAVEARAQDAKIWVWREVEPSMPAGKQSDSIHDPASENFRFYRPPHPRTGKPCVHPKRGWAFPQRAIAGRGTFESLVADDRILFKEDESSIPQQKYFLHEVESVVATSVIRQYADGEPRLEALFGQKGLIDNPKPPALVERLVRQTDSKGQIVLDYFAGSGTTGHAVIAANRLDGGNRKFILAEVGDYFETVLVPRVKKVAFAAEWEAGRPQRPASATDIDRSPRALKIITLESYDDTLANVRLARSTTQQRLLATQPSLRSDYMLRYMLKSESQGSSSFLNTGEFEDPFNYELAVTRNGETQNLRADLVETFTFLIGLRVSTIRDVDGVRVVAGVSPDGQRILVLWRKLKELDNATLNSWFQKQGFNSQEQEFDFVYVNGSNALQNLRTKNQTWEVRSLEEAFHRLMFTVADV